jgi:hypothetical protein
MSGGHFEYQQDKIKDIANTIECILCRSSDGYSGDTLREIKVAIYLLKKAHIYVERIDRLVCNDDGEETFHERLKEELSKL